MSDSDDRPEVAHQAGADEQLASQNDDASAAQTWQALMGELAQSQPLMSTAALSQLESRMSRRSAGDTRGPTSNLIRNALAPLMISTSPLANMPTLDRSTVKMLRSLLSFATLSRPDAYSGEIAKPESYSSDMTSPGAFFTPQEVVIDSFDTLNRKLVALIQKADGLELVWRGQPNADWGVHSSLFRRLKEINKVKDPGRRATGKQPYPTEDQMAAAEKEILRAARTNWRLDGLSALETFARIQHAGGSTRLIDVTKNPFIGAWFAVESDRSNDEQDARLFAFATTAPLQNGPINPDVQIEMDSEWGRHSPVWHDWTDAPSRQGTDWGTGSRRRVWVPPAYDARIAAQNAAFLLDGVPIPAAGLASYFKSPSGIWTRADILAAGSIYLKTLSPNRKPRPNQFNIAPVFTFRITAEAKEEIRGILTERFGYTTSYIYPDVTKLAEYVKSMDLPTLQDVEAQS